MSPMSVLLTLLFISPYYATDGIFVNRSDRNYKTIPDSNKNTGDFVEKWGYPVEEHDVNTADGFTLTLFRIPYGKKGPDAKRKPVPVLMQHGIYLNSDQWVLRGPHDLPFYLSEMGFDVWMSNTRGTRYSRHRRYTMNQFQFWNYSPDEITTYHSPALVDYVLATTNSSSLSYVGHSRGCAMAFMLLSERPEYNKKIHLLQLLAPVVYSSYASSIIYYLAGKPSSLMSTTSFQNVMQKANLGRLLYIPAPVTSMMKELCSSGTVLDKVCPFFYFFFNGEDFKNYNYSLSPLIMDHFQEGVSTKEIIHLQQISEKNSFQKYDYGSRGNVMHYGQNSPPIYNISKTLVPTYLYYGSNDAFIHQKDLDKLIPQIRNLLGAFKVPYPRFNHVDYIWGLNTNEVLFPTFLKDILYFHKKNKLM